MSMSSRLQGIVCDAELCKPLAGVRVASLSDRSVSCETDDQGRWVLDAEPQGPVEFAKPGFTAKRYAAGAVPERVRLLSDRLLGYQDGLNFLPGETVAARIHAPTPYRARLLRYGLERLEVLDLGENPPCLQTVPDGLFVDTGLSWKETLNYTIPDNAQPGLYGLFLETDSDVSSFAIPMVVSTPPAARGDKSRLLVLTSTATWQSYNIWGGRSRYRNFETQDDVPFQVVARKEPFKKRLKRRLPPRLVQWIKQCKALWRSASRNATPPWQKFRLSVQRPFTNCALEEHDDPNQPFTNHLAAGEWRVLAWLEREGIAYDVVTGHELHRDPELLASYDAILLSTHCEYWTKEMYTALRTRHFYHGLSVLNLSGNSIFREIEFYEDGSSRCVSLFFEKGCADETEVLGVRFDMSDYGSCAPFKAVQPDHPLFEGCPLDADGVFGRDSLNRDTPVDREVYNPGRPGSGQKGSPYALHGRGASGWETDKRPPHRENEFELLAKGLNSGGGADMVCRLPGGTRGLLFSASSLTFGAALLIDPVISRLAHNAIRHGLARG